MPADRRFDDYLSRHYAHLGEQSRHRAAKQRQLRRTYERWLSADRSAPLLEIGPGYGQMLELLRRDLGYSSAIAVDVSREVVEFCNAAMPGSTTLVEDTTAWLAAQPARFERVIALHVLEHVPREHAPAFVRAMAGALRPGGRVVLEVPNMANLFTASYLRYGDLTHETGFTEASLRQLLEANGFAQVECFEERLANDGPRTWLASAFRAIARAKLRLIYRGYELPVPSVLTPALCATAVRAPQSA